MKHETILNSSNIASVGYDSDESLLEVTFKSKSTYQYEGFPADLHEAFMKAPSKGKFFAQYIKNEYAFTKQN